MNIWDRGPIIPASKARPFNQLQNEDHQPGPSDVAQSTSGTVPDRTIARTKASQRRTSDPKNQESFAVWCTHTKETNKTILPLIVHNPVETTKRNFRDRQPNAQKAQWDTQEVDGELSPGQKRTREETEDTDDEAFQSDERIPDASRREFASVPRELQTVTASWAQRPSKSRYVREDSQNRQAMEEVLGSNLVSERKADEDDYMPNKTDSGSEEDIELEHKENLFAKLEREANVVVIPNRTYAGQTRVPWSEADTQLLIRRIGEYNCKWSEIANNTEGFEKQRDQVALKDKARNIKVKYLR